MNLILVFIVTAIIFALIDAAWLKSTSRFYKSELGGLLLKVPNFPAAVLFYLIYVVGMIVFAVHPALEQQNWGVALGYGATLGFIAYATYDLTNLATLRKWSRTVVIVDMAWGTVVTAAASTAAYFVLSAWLGL
ncbi:hypothetical protein D3C85_311510 [compost metagenome]